MAPKRASDLPSTPCKDAPPAGAIFRSRCAVDLTSLRPPLDKSAAPVARSQGQGERVEAPPHGPHHTMIVALINPSACSSHGAEIAHALASSSPRMRLVISDSEDDVDALIQDIIDQRTELLVVAGGDGTLLNLITNPSR